MNIQELLRTIPGIDTYRNRYIKFIQYCIGNNAMTEHKVTELHHICPSSLFPEYRNLRKCQWNSARLTPRQHFLAHYLLHKAYGGKMTAAFVCMSQGLMSPKTKRKSEEYSTLVPSILYENAKVNFKNIPHFNLGKRRKLPHKRGKVTCKDLITGEIFLVTQDEFKNNPNLVGLNTGNNRPAKKGIARPNFTGKRHSEESKKKISDSMSVIHKGRVVINNGLEEKKVFPHELPAFPEFSKGRLKYRCHDHGIETTIQNLSKHHKGCNTSLVDIMLPTESESSANPLLGRLLDGKNLP